MTAPQLLDVRRLRDEECTGPVLPEPRCDDCEWQTIQLRALCQVEPLVEYVLVRPCKEHA